MDERSLERVPRTRKIVVAPGQKPERIDSFLTNAVENATRTKVQEAIVAGAVTVNGRPTKSNYRVRPGDDIELTVMKPPIIELYPQDIPLDIVYEDDDLIVVNKTAGMVTHPGYGNRDGTLVNAVLFHTGGFLPAIPDESVVEDAEEPIESEVGATEDVEAEPSPEQLVRPGIVHRLDKDTSGLMAVAKNETALSKLARQFAERTAKREYWAVVWGVPSSDEGKIEGNIARDPRDRRRFAVSQRDGKYALTTYRVLERFEFASLLSLRLATGRTHQIRVHCAHIGHPLFGDPTYGGRSAVYAGSGGKHRQRVANLLERMNRQALHAKTLGIRQPTSGEWLEFDSELPQDMKDLIAALRDASTP